MWILKIIYYTKFPSKHFILSNGTEISISVANKNRGKTSMSILAWICNSNRSGMSDLKRAQMRWRKKSVGWDFVFESFEENLKEYIEQMKKEKKMNENHSIHQHQLSCSDNKVYYILCMHISVIKPWIKMIPVKWYDVISLSEMISYHFTVLNCPIK